MKYKLLFLIALLMFVVLTGILLYKSSGLFYNIESQLISYLEDNYQIEIEVGETSFWPINQMILKDAKINSMEGDFSISVPEISVYYDFFSFLSTAGKPGHAIEFISLNKPVIEISGTELLNEKFDSSQYSDLEEATRDNISEVLNRLSSIAPFQIKVDEGDLIYNNNIQFTRLNILFKVISEDESRIQIDTAVHTNRIVWGKYEFNKMAFENLRIVMSLNGDDWQGNLETDYLDIPDLSEYMETSDDALISYSDIQGLIKSNIYFAGEGSSLNEYNGTFSLKDGQGELFIQNSKEETPIISNYSIGNHDLSFRDFSGEIMYDSNTEMISAEELEFNLNQNLFKLNGSLEVLPNGNYDVFGHLRTNQLDLSKFNILPDKLNIEGLIVMDYTIEGLLSNPNMNLNLSLLDGEVNNIKVENMVSNLRYYKGNTYLDQLNFVLNKTNQFTMNGIVNNNNGYSFDLESRDVDISLLNQSEYFLRLLGDNYSDISGVINLTANLTGKGLGLENLNAAGKIEIVEPSFYLSNTKQKEKDTKQDEDYIGQEELEIDETSQGEEMAIKKLELSRLSSEFYLSEETIFIHEGTAIADWGELALSGEIGLNESDLDIKVDSEYINSGEILSSIAEQGIIQADIGDITGEFSLDGSIQGKINSPLIRADISSSEGSLKGYRYNDFTANLRYYNSELAINDIDVNYNQAVISGGAIFDFTSARPSLNGNLITKGFSYDLISSVLRQENITSQLLPVNGNIDVMLSLDGALANPTIALQAKSTNTNIIFNDNEIPIDVLELVMDGGIDGLYIDELSLTKGEASIRADGTIAQKSLDLRYEIDDFSLQYIFEGIDNLQLNGLMELTGSIAGNLDSPIIDGKLTINNMEYQQNQMGNISGDLLYSDKKVKLDSLIWKNGQGEYIIDGEIDNLLEEASLNLSLSTEQGYLKDFAFFGIGEEIETFALQDYKIVGEALVTGPISDISTRLNLSMITINNDTIQFVGDIGQKINISILGQGVTIDKYLSNYTDRNIDGELGFTGKISGMVDSINLILDTKMNNVVIGGVSIEDVQGKIEIIEGSTLSFEQVMSYSSDSGMDISGSLPIEEGLDGLDLSLSLRRFPLQFLTVYNNLWTDVSGIISGDIELNGGIDNPTLAGELNVNNAGFNLGLAGIADRFSSINGDLLLNGQQISLEEISGKYGKGDFLITGLIEPFDENLDLILEGKNLPFDYGSFKGQFDPDMTVTGSLEAPFIKADLLTHNLNVRMPFEWPTSNTDGGNLRFDLTIRPGNEVYLLNNNINILVQEGSLNINNSQEQVVFSGELSSRQGVFDFYNNRFILEEGTALFERSFDENKSYIPTVNASAWTNIGGTRVEVMLNGKANNMVTTFSSSPPLSQDEILALLSSRGGLGEFTTGDLGNVVQSELYRWLYSQLQLDVVEGVQNTIRNMFSLDRLEVDAYNLGWNDQLSIYAGKYLNSRLYLEYTDVIINNNNNFISDNQGELSLQYIFNDNITIESSWQGDEDYSLSLETNFEF